VISPEETARGAGNLINLKRIPVTLKHILRA